MIFEGTGRGVAKDFSLTAWSFAVSVSKKASNPGMRLNPDQFILYPVQELIIRHNKNRLQKRNQIDT